MTQTKTTLLSVKNFSNPDTARKEVNRITRLLFNKDRYTPEMLKELSKRPSEIL